MYEFEHSSDGTILAKEALLEPRVVLCSINLEIGFYSMKSLFVCLIVCSFISFCACSGPSPNGEKTTEATVDGGGLPESSSEHTTGSQKVALMSFNIRYGSADDGDNHWEKRKTLVFDIINKKGGDFLGMQEVLRTQYNEVIKIAPQYKCIGRERHDTSFANPDYNEMNPICYLHKKWELDTKEHGTFWLSESPEEPGSRSWKSSLPRICTWARFTSKATGKSLYIFNTHYDHQSGLARLNSSTLVAKRIAQRKDQEAPAFLMGDFNDGEDSDTIKYLKGEEVSNKPSPPISFVDTFRVVHPNAGKAGTNNYWIGLKIGPKIDYIFSMPDRSFEVRVLSAAIVHDHVNGRFPSDHFPVVATIEF